MDFDPSQHVDERVTIRGLADNGRAGALVLLPDETPIYVVGLYEWDEDVADKEVEVTGTLVQRPAQAPRRPPHEPQVHGLGESFALREASWTVVE